MREHLYFGLFSRYNKISFILSPCLFYHFYFVSELLGEGNEKKKKKEKRDCLCILVTLHPSLTMIFRDGVYPCEGLLQWLSGKESACNAGDLGSVPGSGKSPGGGHSNPLQYSCLENPMDRGAWRAAVHGVVQSRTHLSTYSCDDLFQQETPFLTVSMPTDYAWSSEANE